MQISRFHYLTQDLPGISHQELAEIACKNGIRWIQLRVKNKPFEDWLQIAKEVKQICNHFQTTLIINDHAEIAKAVDADGVHVGKSDVSVLAARKIVGESKIIGATANKLEDILAHQKNGVNYIGLGPYKFTKTKEKLNPILGLEGYSIIQQSNNSIIPIIAIGGIQIEDVQPLMNTGIHGMAVSSVINLADDKAKVISSFLELL
jgi:thiamine-phosphate pyrophosphorylase